VYWLLISFRNKENCTWAGKGFEIAWDQFELPWHKDPGQAPESIAEAPDIKQDGDLLIISGKGFAYVFDTGKGVLTSMTVSGAEMIKSGPVLNLWRAPLANETDEWGYSLSNTRHRKNGYGRYPSSEWYSSGLDRMTRVLDYFSLRTTKEGNAVIEVNFADLLGTGTGAFLDHLIYTIDGDGVITIDHTVTPDGDVPSWLPRIGTEWVLAGSLGNVEWYGRGPQENYPDRKSGYRTGVYRLAAGDMYEPYLMPQDYGLRCDNRWVRMTDSSGRGLEFKGDKLFNFSAHQYPTDNLTKAVYTYQLRRDEGITFNLDYATSGVGCTALSVFPAYQVMPQKTLFRVTVRPVMP
jgi:beta-galactosidase